MGGDAIPYDRIAGFASAMAPYLPADTGRPILDVGVATGAVAAPLASRTGRVVVGVDLSLPMLRHAAGRIPGRVVQGDACRLPCADGAVDAVVLSLVLHVVGDVDAAVAEAARVLRPGGQALVVEGDNLEVGGRAGLAVVAEALTAPRPTSSSPCPTPSAPASAASAAAAPVFAPDSRALARDRDAKTVSPWRRPRWGRWPG